MTMFSFREIWKFEMVSPIQFYKKVVSFVKVEYALFEDFHGVLSYDLITGQPHQ